MAITHLYSIPLGKYKLPKFEKIRKKLIPILEDDYYEADDKNRKDNDWQCNSYQTWLWGNGQEQLAESLYPFIDDYLIQLGFEGFSYQLESWFNIYGKQQYQEKHNHGTTLLSGMVVLNYDPAQHTPLKFYNPWQLYSTTFQMFDLKASMNFIATTYPIEMENGYMYIWPSSLEHIVPPQPNKLRDLRITYTFNVLPDHKWNSVTK